MNKPPSPIADEFVTGAQLPVHGFVRPMRGGLRRNVPKSVNFTVRPNNRFRNGPVTKVWAFPRLFGKRLRGNRKRNHVTRAVRRWVAHGRAAAIVRFVVARLQTAAAAIVEEAEGRRNSLSFPYRIRDRRAPVFAYVFLERPVYHVRRKRSDKR